MKIGNLGAVLISGGSGIFVATGFSANAFEESYLAPKATWGLLTLYKYPEAATKVSECFDVLYRTSLSLIGVGILLIAAHRIAVRKASRLSP